MMIHIANSTSESKLLNQHLLKPEDIQPNAVDVRVDKVFKINDTTFTIDEESKQHRGSNELSVDQDGYFNLEPGAYEVIMEGIVRIGRGEAGWVITRSTLNRNGLYITSGLYDSGYEGVMAGVLHVTCGPARIKQGTRIGQFLLFESDTVKMYDGDYGVNSDHDKKYK